jgi:hypothetical protein
VRWAGALFRGSTRPISQIKPGLRHREEAPLVSDVLTGLCKLEAVSGEPPILAFLTHRVDPRLSNQILRRDIKASNCVLFQWKVGFTVVPGPNFAVTGEIV